MSLSLSCQWDWTIERAVTSEVTHFQSLSIECNLWAAFPEVSAGRLISWLQPCILVLMATSPSRVPHIVILWQPQKDDTKCILNLWLWRYLKSASINMLSRRTSFSSFKSGSCNHSDRYTISSSLFLQWVNSITSLSFKESSLVYESRSIFDASPEEKNNYWVPLIPRGD